MPVVASTRRPLLRHSSRAAAAVVSLLSAVVASLLRAVLLGGAADDRGFLRRGRERPLIISGKNSKSSRERTPSADWHIVDQPGAAEVDGGEHPRRSVDRCGDRRQVFGL